MANIDNNERNKPIESPYEKVEYYMDYLFKFYSLNSFNLLYTLNDSDLSDSEYKQVEKLESQITELLIANGYATYTGSSFTPLLLTEKGRDAKRKGGHFAYLKYLDERDKPQSSIGTQNNIGNNYGNAIQSGVQSRFENVANNLPMQPQIIPTTNKDQKGYWLVNILSNNWIITIVGCAIATIIAAYLIWKFKIPH